MHSFFKVTLRTSDVDAARAFYSAVLGERELDVVQLHEQAVARGAKPHWLGFIEVDDVERAAAFFVERGASPLGPKWINPQGLEAAVMRDPGGAIVALGKPPAAQRPNESGIPGIDWSLLHTTDVERAKKNYGEMFGWQFDAARDVGEHGVFHLFAFDTGGQPAGSMTDIATRPEVHPHWLFHHHVDSLDAALESARAFNANIIGPFTLPSGHRVAVCDDPQGAAFALYEKPALP
ncbi:MAG: hypothetical protein IPK60_04310 [Sandaracinaceae bacterium]|nr:hypothetical protein [Sandaracinaceae bacterium]